GRQNALEERRQTEGVPSEPLTTLCGAGEQLSGSAMPFGSERHITSDGHRRAEVRRVPRPSRTSTLVSAGWYRGGERYTNASRSFAQRFQPRFLPMPSWTAKSSIWTRKANRDSMT